MIRQRVGYAFFECTLMVHNSLAGDQRQSILSIFQNITNMSTLGATIHILIVVFTTIAVTTKQLLDIVVWGFDDFD